MNATGRDPRQEYRNFALGMRWTLLFLAVLACAVIGVFFGWRNKSVPTPAPAQNHADAVSPSSNPDGRVDPLPEATRARRLVFELKDATGRYPVRWTVLHGDLETRGSGTTGEPTELQIPPDAARRLRIFALSTDETGALRWLDETRDLSETGDHDLRLVFSSLSILKGVLRDSNGSPLRAFAAVSFSHSRSADPVAWREFHKLSGGEHDVLLPTNDAGEFELRGLHPDLFIAFFVKSSLRGRFQYRVTTDLQLRGPGSSYYRANPAGTFTVLLEQLSAAEVLVSVRTAGGVGVPGARTLLRHELQSRSATGAATKGWATDMSATDDSGRSRLKFSENAFTKRDDPKGIRFIALAHDPRIGFGYSTGFLPARDESVFVELPSPEFTSTLSGDVVSSADGAAIPGACVSIYCSAFGGGEIARLTTDEHGEFSLAKVPPTSWDAEGSLQVPLWFDYEVRLGGELARVYRPPDRGRISTDTPKRIVLERLR